MSVLDILLSKNLITKDDYTEVKKQTSSGKVSLDQILMARGGTKTASFRAPHPRPIAEQAKNELFAVPASGKHRAMKGNK